MSDIYSKYSDFYLSREDGPLFPNEGVVRIVLGRYPNLDLSSHLGAGKVVADIGCGDGRNLLPFKEKKMTLLGTEITDEICQSVVRKLARFGVSAEIKKGFNDTLPFDDSQIDILLSWNAGYYFSGDGRQSPDFSRYAKEFARVLKSRGILILSVPMPTSFIFKNSAEFKHGYRIIKDDPYNIRDGEIMRCFSDENDLKSELSQWFNDFRFGILKDDFFGQQNHSIVAVATKI